MFQFAVFIACQMPFRFGLPSGARGALYAGACAAASVATSRAAEAATAAFLVVTNRFRILFRALLLHGPAAAFAADAASAPKEAGHYFFSSSRAPTRVLYKP